MDGFVRFLTNGRSIFRDAYDLMHNPTERQHLDERVEEFIGSFSPLKHSRRQPPTLDKLQNVIDFTEYFTRHAAKGFLAFTVVNIIVYHFTRLLTFIALTYLISIFIFGMIYLDTSEIAETSKDIKGILSENEASQDLKQALVAKYIKRNEHWNFHQTVKQKVAHNNIKIVLQRMERLKRSLIVTRPLARIPIDQIIKHLNKLEADLSTKLHVQPRTLHF